MTSEHEIYKNDPAAKHENKISTIFDPVSKTHPRITPMGVNIENTIKSLRMKLSLLGKVLVKLIPSEIAAAPLCMQIAIEKSKVPWKFSDIPKANPSNIE